MAHTIASATGAVNAVHIGAGVAPEDAGRLVLRLTVAIFMLLHGIGKIAGGVDPIADMLAQHGLPGVLAYGAYGGEVLAPLLVIVGLWTIPAALVMAFNMVVAIALVHGDAILSLGKEGGWAIELQGFYLFGAIAVALLGAGSLSVSGSRGRWN